ncbi:MAG: YCF48-related protein [Pirellulaceae bacterium]
MKRRLRDVQFVDSAHGWACGDHGTILRTEDGGATWFSVESGLQCCLESISFVDDRHGWIAGGYELPGSGRRCGVILFTSDGGQSWSRLDTESLPWLHRIKIVDGRDGFAIGDVSTLHRSGVFITRDGGSQLVDAQWRRSDGLARRRHFGPNEFQLGWRSNGSASLHGR